MEGKIQELLSKFYRELPHFPDGRIDYSHAKEALVLNIFVFAEGKLLLLKRSDKVRAYKNTWHVVGGYLDENVSLDKKVKEELREEIDVSEEKIKSLVSLEIRKKVDEEIGVTWLVIPIKVELAEMFKIKLDWEHTEYAWIEPKDIVKYDVVPGVAEAVSLWK